MTYSNIKRYLFFSVLAALAMAVFTIGINAQSGTSAVSGTVVDAQGNAVPGATVTLISTGQSTQRTATTDGDGSYGFTSLVPGIYSLEVTASGFKKSSTTGIQALVEKPTTIPVRLEIGDVSAVVEVSAGGIESLVNTQDGSLGSNFVEEQIKQLPLEGRNVAELLSLQPGVTPDGAVAGGRQDQANITLDGVDVNDQQTGLNNRLNPTDAFEAFTSVLRVTPDSIGEFRVTTSNPDASKGRSAGAQVSLITKSGTNEFRGNLFEYHRNHIFNAGEWFDNNAGLPVPKLIRNLYGGSLGGPILKDRLFFFYNYEGMREAKEVGVTQLVPLPSLGQGIIKFFDNGGVLRQLTTAEINGLVSGATPVIDVNPFVVNFLAGAAARYPSNISGGDGINTGGFRFTSPLPVKQSTHTARFDWAVTGDQKHQVSFRGNYQQDIFGRNRAFPDTPPSDRWSHPLGLAATHTWLVSNNITNRFSYGLTRLAYSDQGDSSENAITFRDVFQQFNYTRTFSRVNPTQNFTNDLTWIKDNHTLQFGTNIRIIRNKRTSLANAFDFGTTNFGAYPGGGSSLLVPVNQYLAATYGPGVSVGTAGQRSLQSPLSALLGRLSQFTANFVFDLEGNPVANQPTVREWATEEYDFYAQDSWKVRQSLTLNLGLRYGLSRPVYETQGFQVAPNIPLDEYFRNRQVEAFNGRNYNVPLIIDLAGPKNNRPDFYAWDTDNFQPRISVAWSPNFKDGLLAKVFGRDRASVLRGGVAITNDYFGQQLAVTFDAGNTLGFVSRFNTSLNQFNITTNPGPTITSLNMDIAGLPQVVEPANLVFPLQEPANNALAVRSSLDRGVQSPINYSFNVTYGRELPAKMYLEVSYIGRLARHLLATRDIMTANNIRDPLTGQDFYTAATALEIQKRAGASTASIANDPYWDNIYGPGVVADFFFGPGSGLTNTEAIYEGLAFFGDNDWTDVQRVLDAIPGKRLFFNSQYGALDSFGTIANSDYHGMAVSLRQRFGGLTWDLNYTFSKSLDDTSGLQTAAAFGGAFILNPLRQRDNYAPSDFDMRHIINFNSVWQLPFGRGQQFFSDVHPVVDALFGGWQLSTIARFNTGEPIGSVNKLFDNSGWVTNWQIKSGVVQTRPIETGVFISDGGIPNLFADREEAYKSFRSPFPGEQGTRNSIRFPSYMVLDMGLQKSFKMPWSENHRLGVRWDVFNVTNTPVFTGIARRDVGYNREIDGGAPSLFGEFTGTKSAARVMQFAIRYDF